jgi:hypothetical protein
MTFSEDSQNAWVQEATPTQPSVALGPPFKTPAARDKEGNKRRRDEQAVFGIGNVKVALGSKDYIVIAAEINDGATGWLTPAEKANFERFKAERIGWIKDAAAVDAGLADKVTGAAQSRSRLGDLMCHSRRDHGIEQRHVAEWINVGPDEIRQRRALLQHPFVVGEGPWARAVGVGLIPIDESQKAPIGIEHLERERDKVAERIRILSERSHIGLNHRDQGSLGIVGVETMIDARSGADASTQVGDQIVFELEWPE